MISGTGLSTDRRNVSTRATVAAVARKDQAVQIGKGFDLDALLQRGGHDLLDLGHGAVSQRHDRRRSQPVALRRAENIDSPLAVIGELRPFEQHGKQRFEIRIVDPYAGGQADGRLEVIVQAELPAQVEDDVLHLPAGDMGRDAAERIDVQFVF